MITNTIKYEKQLREVKMNKYSQYIKLTGYEYLFIECRVYKLCRYIQGDY